MISVVYFFGALLNTFKMYNKIRKPKKVNMKRTNSKIQVGIICLIATGVIMISFINAELMAGAGLFEYNAIDLPYSFLAFNISNLPDDSVIASSKPYIFIKGKEASKQQIVAQREGSINQIQMVQKYGSLIQHSI